MDSVTIVVLGYNSKPFLQDCFSSLQQMERIPDQLEFLFVDNASQDNSTDWMREHFPGVRVSANPTNLGFCGGNNTGAQQARSEWIAFLNPDMRVAPNWLAEMLRVVREDPNVDCVASRIMNWDGSLVDFGGAAMNLYGYGMQDGIGKPPVASRAKDKDVLFPCGGAMLIRRDVFLEVGGFDEDFFAFLEDVDLGWRLWVLGYTVKYAGRAVVYHHHHGSWGRASERQRQRLLERNALACILKNYEEHTLQKILPVALHLMAYRAFLTSGIDPADFRPSDLLLQPRTVSLHWLSHVTRVFGKLAWDIFWQEGPMALLLKGIQAVRNHLLVLKAQGLEKLATDREMRSGRQPEYAAVVPDRTFAYFEAAQDILDLYDRIMEKRQAIQAARQRPDEKIFPLFLEPFTPNYPDYEYLLALHELCRQWSLYEMFE